MRGKEKKREKPRKDLPTKQQMAQLTELLKAWNKTHFRSGKL